MFFGGVRYKLFRFETTWKNTRKIEFVKFRSYGFITRAAMDLIFGSNEWVEKNNGL